VRGIARSKTKKKNRFRVVELRAAIRLHVGSLSAGGEHDRQRLAGEATGVNPNTQKNQRDGTPALKFLIRPSVAH